MFVLKTIDPIHKKAHKKPPGYYTAVRFYQIRMEFLSNQGYKLSYSYLYFPSLIVTYRKMTEFLFLVDMYCKVFVIQPQEWEQKTFTAFRNWKDILQRPPRNFGFLNWQSLECQNVLVGLIEQLRICTHLKKCPHCQRAQEAHEQPLLTHRTHLSEHCTGLGKH